MLSLLSSLLLATAVAAAPAAPNKPDESGRYTLSAKGIKAQFIPYGATLTNLWVSDKNGVQRDVVLGYDNTTYYPVDPGHPVLNAIPGPYVNRIGNGTFVLDGKRYFLEKNDGPNTLHSGTNNWSFRFWSVAAVTDSSITFSIHSTAESTGMPGAIQANVTYTLTPNRWNIKMRAVAEKRTPIMLTQHTYFNLDAYANPSTDLILNHTLHLPYSRRFLTPDPNMLPTGGISKPPVDDINDFYSRPRQIGFASSRPEWKGNCGTASGCSGYNNLWIIDNADSNRVVATLASAWSGISAKLRTNQQGVVIYSSYWMDGSQKIKSGQGRPGGDGNVKSSGAIAIEAHDWVDGVNHPEWGRVHRQIYGPGQVYEWEASWEFSAEK